MPPFAVEQGESGAHHGGLQGAEAVGDFGIAVEVGGPGAVAEIIECGGHGEFLAVGIEHGDIHGPAVAVVAPAAFEAGFVDVAALAEIFEEEEVAFRRAVGVPDFELVAAGRQQFAAPWRAWRRCPCGSGRAMRADKMGIQ